MLRTVLMVGWWVLVLAPAGWAQHEQRPAKPPRNMFIDLTVERARGTRGGSWEWSAQNQNVKLTVTLNNRNTTQDYKKLTGYCYVLAQSVENRERFKLVIKENETFDLPRGQKIQRESSEVYLRFWKHYGFKYYGYVYLVEDQDQKVLVGSASVDKLWDKLDKLVDLKLNQEFSF